MSQFIDRRPNNSNKSAVNRRRFLKRVQAHVKDYVSNSVKGRSITDMEQGEKINIPAKDVNEPNFHFGKGGRRDIILPGNKEFSKGDRIKRPDSGGSGQGSGSQASDSGEGEDEFAFQISQEEFLNVFFEDLELPNLIQKKLKAIPTYKFVRAGFTTDGNPSNINIVRSVKGALSRRIATGGNLKKRLKEEEEKLKELQKKHADKTPPIEDQKKIIAELKSKIKKIPFIDPFDLRYNNKIIQSKPSTQAVMFCLMDVSGSMDEMKKDIAKRFFILLYLFLNKNYEKIELVFIRHHTSAKEVNEQDFFYSRETGGTVVSSALELMQQIMQERYPIDEWNIYGAQASDGDNWNNDSPRCREILVSDILPLAQYFAYIEIMPRHHQSLWEAYSSVADAYPQFAMQHITDAKDIYPVFRNLFKRQEELAS